MKGFFVCEFFFFFFRKEAALAGPISTAAALARRSVVAGGENTLCRHCVSGSQSWQAATDNNI